MNLEYRLAGGDEKRLAVLADGNSAMALQEERKPRNQDLGCDTPLIRLTDRRWVEARDALGPDEDNSKAILAWQNVK